MNRSILIVICDFLLVSLLAFSTVDINKVANNQVQRSVKLELVTNQVNQADSGKDLAAVMRLALDEERKNRDQLLGELTRAQDTAAKQQTMLTKQESLLTRQEAMLNERQAVLTEREKQIANYQRDLQAQEDEGQRLQQQHAALMQQFATAQTNLQNLSQQLHERDVKAVISGEKIAALEDMIRQQTDQAGSLQKELTDLSKSNLVVQTEKQRLSSELQVAQTEKRLAVEQVAHLQDEVKVERAERVKLAAGVQSLATKTGDLATKTGDLAAKTTELVAEVRDNRALAPNAIFTEFVSNRVEASFSAVRGRLFGESVKTREAQTVLFSDGTNTFALCHVQETPLTLWEPGIDWEGLTGSLTRSLTLCPIHSLSFCLGDPRVVLIPVSADDAHRLGCKVYHVSTDPYKFQDAVLVGARDGYYGECKFQIDLTTPEYVKLDRSFLKGLFGKFNPSRGDLVFSKSGELLGVMTNGSYCWMLHNFDTVATFQFGQDIRAQHTGAILSALYSQVLGMPFRLQ